MGVPPIEPWQNEHRIDVLLNNPTVRFRVEQAAQSSSRPMTLQQFYAKSAAALWVIPGMQVVALFPLAGLAGEQMWKALGIGVERTKSLSCPQPIGQVTVALLCALARHGCPIQRTVQRDDGCFLETKVPSSWKAPGGTSACIVTSKPGGTEIQIGMMISGVNFGFTVERRVSAILEEVRKYSESF